MRSAACPRPAAPRRPPPPRSRPQRRSAAHSVVAAAVPDDASPSSSSPSEPDSLRASLLFVPRARRARADWTQGPALDLSADDALSMQMTALADNDRPYRDHGVEVLYRFSDLDPFVRSSYFGTLMDLGQFERFRRCFHTRTYARLLNHDGYDIVARFDWEGAAGERRALRRVAVSPPSHAPPPVLPGPSPSTAAPDTATPTDSGLFDVSLVARSGGRADGVWMTASLVAVDAAARADGVWPPPV